MAGERAAVRRDARLRAIEVIVEQRERIGSDDVVRKLLSDLLNGLPARAQWSTPAAKALGPKPARGTRQSDHVVPVLVLVDRLLDDHPIEEVADAIVLCHVSHEEHNGVAGLANFKRVHRDLREAMRTCRSEELLDLAWQRYRSAGLSWSAI